ncbi:MAG: hypothetical protein V1861_04475 [Candidatus Micrarchaeota archaeon]
MDNLDFLFEYFTPGGKADWGRIGKVFILAVIAGTILGILEAASKGLQMQDSFLNGVLRIAAVVAAILAIILVSGYAERPLKINKSGIFLMLVILLFVPLMIWMLSLFGNHSFETGLGFSLQTYLLWASLFCLVCIIVLKIGPSVLGRIDGRSKPR